ncbi:oligosaccharide flippase family protein [Candidatus Azambacteria bacterium]|nr:oligosaccharide flippase family protein [Candidatus Azambacteria bacterium]
MASFLERTKQRLHDILRKTEKYTKTDMVYLAKGGTWLTLGHIVAVISSFLLTIAFANLLPKEAYGTYKYILSIAGMIMALSLTGFKTAVVQSVARGFEGVLKAAFKTNLRWSMGMPAVSLAGAIYYFLNDNTTLAVSLLIIGFFSPLLSSSGLYSMFLTGKKEFKTTAIYEAFNNIIPALSLFIALLITQKPVALVFVYFFSTTAVSLALYFYTLWKYKPTDITDPSSISYGKHLSAMNILGTIVVYVDRVLVFHYLGAAQLAIYAFATVMPEQIKALLSKNIAALALPKFSEKSMTEIKANISGRMIKAGLAIATMTALYIIAAPYIFKIFFPQYFESVFYSQIFSISLMAALYVVPINILQSQNMTQALYRFNTAAPIVQIILLFFLTSSYGLAGAITAQITAKFFNLCLSLVLLARAR